MIFVLVTGATPPDCRRREGCQGAQTGNDHNPPRNILVAGMKHCSILAFNVLCSAQTGGREKPFGRGLVRKGAEESDVCYGN
jgi:hypothetical protein